MNTGSESWRPKLSRGFSVTELLIIVATVVLLAAVFLPGYLSPAKPRSKRLNCTNHMKQIGLAFRCWSLDNNERFPMQLSVTNGGTMELAAGRAVYPHFQIMSNELSNPKVLVCPQDTQRNYATNFNSLTDENLSYFLNMDSIEADGAILLAGDRNITNKPMAGSRLVYISKAVTLAWTKEMHSEAGNVGFGDGSVNQFRNQSVRVPIQLEDGVTNRLAVP